VLPADLPAEWLRLAELFREHGVEPAAAAYESCASQLEGAEQDWGKAPLTLQQSAKESGYSPDHLGRLTRDGKVPNAGRPGAPRIARRDLPRKATEVAHACAHDDNSNRQVVQSIIAREGVA
jgi:hypothetical protein